MPNIATCNSLPYVNFSDYTELQVLRSCMSLICCCVKNHHLNPSSSSKMLLWNHVIRYFSSHHFSLGIGHTATNPGFIENLCVVPNIVYILTNISRKWFHIFAVNCFITDLYLCRHMQFSCFWVRLSKYFFFKCPMLDVSNDIFAGFYFSHLCLIFFLFISNKPLWKMLQI